LFTTKWEIFDYWSVIRATSKLEEIENKAKTNANIFHLRHWIKDVRVKKWQATFNQLIDLIENKQLFLMETNTAYDLLVVKEAVEEAESPKGKVLLTSY